MFVVEGLEKMSLEFTENYRKWGDKELGQEQVDSINFLLKRQGAVLSLQTGLGKSLTVLVANRILQDNISSLKTVIVCPVKAMKAFKREINLMGYREDEVGYISTQEFEYDVDRNKLFVFTDTNIGKYIDIVAEIVARGSKVALIIDEAHKLQDKQSKFYQTMIQVRSVCSVFWLLTATPLLNGLDSLYYIVDFAVPGFLGKKYKFDDRYTIWHLKDQYVKGGTKRKIKVLDGYKNLDELNSRLKEIMIVRQKKYDLKFACIDKDMTDEENRVYEKVSSGILSYGDDERNFSRRMHDLQRFIDRAYDSDEDIKKLVKDVNVSGYSTKESTLVDTLHKCLDRGYSTIIYCDYKETIERLHKVLKSKRVDLGLGRIFEITGSIDIKTRESVEERIGQRDVILITSAGTESINLQKCNCIIFYDIPFSVKQTIQAVGRICRRDSQYKYQYCIFITMKGTIDEYKYRLFHNHLNLVQQSVGAGTDIPLNEEYLIQDSRDIQRMKDEYLWKFRGSTETKKIRKDKKIVKDRIKLSSLEESDSLIASNKFLIEPLDVGEYDVKEVPALYPDKELYRKFLDGGIPYTVLRSSYLDYLNSEKGKKLIIGLREGVLNRGDLVLVGNTDLKSVLKDEVIKSFGV